MDIFIDSCDIPTIENLFSTGLVDGVTTNPTLVRKSGKDPIWLYEQLVEIGIPDISMEVSGSALEMFNEGLALSKAFGTSHNSQVADDRPRLGSVHFTV